ncbi:hypothetical protein M758_1G289100 [Ceratodon purpureus]|nr:hypothetical protein M758_1G289100 [Ceratodon purpureus]
MKTKMMKLRAVLLIMLVGLSAKTQAACSSGSDLEACLPAAEADVEPTTACCTALNSYLATDSGGTCLCEIASTAAFNSSGAVVEYAITIPEKCSATYSSGTVCNGVTIPGGQ